MMLDNCTACAWMWRHYDPSKRWYLCTSRHGVTSRKT